MSKNGLMFVKREGAEKYLAFRISEWFNTDTFTGNYGVQAQVKKGLWCHIAHNGSPLVFVEKTDAQEEVKRLRSRSKSVSEQVSP